MNRFKKLSTYSIIKEMSTYSIPGKKKSLMMLETGVSKFNLNFSKSLELTEYNFNLNGQIHDSQIILNDKIKSVDINQNWVRYHGAIAFDELHHRYAEADLGVFASSCENLPNILLETMASGLPIACSNRGPMPEILGDCGVYFNPEAPTDITKALLKLIKSAPLRTDLAHESYSQAQKYSWRRCADETFMFIDEVIMKYKGK